MIEIRASRRWVSFGVRRECCFLFIDVHGHAIQATASSADLAYFHNLIRMGSCYRLTNYLREQGRTYMKPVEHDTGIRIGKAAVFQQIPDSGSPEYHFEFVPYGSLRHRDGDNTLLTDYIGRYEDFREPYKSQNVKLAKLILEDLSGNVIEATFWEEMSLLVDKKAIASLPPPVIIALSSMKVTSYLSTIQLESTPASYVYVNPKIPEADAMIAELIARGNQSSALRIDYQKLPNVELEKQRNRYMLGDLLSQNPARYMGSDSDFTCVVTLKDIDESKGWFYMACDKCRKKLLPKGSTLACEDHQPVTDPKSFYLFTTTISDATGEAKAVFFDDAGCMLLGNECRKMVEDFGFTDPLTLPAPLAFLKGSTKILQMRYSRSSKVGNIEFVVNKVFEESLTAGKEILQIEGAATAPCTPAAISASSSRCA